MKTTANKPRRTAPKLEVLQAAAVNPNVSIGAVEAAALAGIGRSFLCRLVKEGRAPAPDIRLNARVVRWRAQTILDWIGTLKPSQAGCGT